MKNTDGLKAHGIVKYLCDCGRLHMILADPDSYKSLRESTKGGVDIFLCQDEIGVCSDCWREVNLPVPELLDLDRSAWGRSLQKMVSEIQESGPREYDSSEDIPF